MSRITVSPPTIEAGASQLRTPARLTTADAVHTKLRSLLMTGALEPGQKLTLRGLAQQFDTSVMPVRDAVRRLTVEGGLQMFPNRTIRVNCPSPARFAEIVKVRCALEGLATETACRQMRNEELIKIRHLAARFEKQGMKPRSNPTLVSRINRDLHFGVYRAARMPLLLEMIEGLWVQVAPALSLTMRHTTRGVTQWESFTHHAKLIESLVTHDAARAKQAIIADIRDAGAFILRSGALELLQQQSSAGLQRRPRMQHRL